MKYGAEIGVFAIKLVNVKENEDKSQETGRSPVRRSQPVAWASAEAKSPWFLGEGRGHLKHAVRVT